MNDLGIVLVWCIVQVTLLATVGAALYGLVRRRGAGAGAPAALGCLLVIVALSALALSPWPRWTLSAWAPESGQSNSTAAAIGDAAPRQSDVNADERPTASAALFEALWSELQLAPAQADPRQWRWPATLAVVLLVAVGLGLARLAVGLVAVRYYRTRSRPIHDRQLTELADVIRAELGCLQPVELRETSLLITAATIGWRRPLVLLPVEWKCWTRDERQAVLAHEMAHVQRGDFLAWVCAQLAVVLHFYHPLVHWLAQRLQLEQELAADAAAARLAGGDRSYVATLAEMALRQPNRPLAWPAQTFLPTRRTFLRRIEMLRDSNHVATGKSSRGTRLATVGALVLAGLLVAGIRAPDGDRVGVAVAAETDEVPAKPTFGPVVERLVHDDNPELGGFLIDFETGKVAPKAGEKVPEGDEQAVLRWMKQNGFDAVGEVKASFKGLFGIDMIAIPRSKQDWNFEPRFIARYLAAGKPGTPIPMSSQGKLPATFFFETREGSRGVLQIVAFDDDPQGVKIRYKLVKDPEKTKKQAGIAMAALRLAMSARSLTAEEARSLEKQIEQDPHDVASRTKLLGYYFGKQFQDQTAREAKQRHVLWLILNAPESEVLATPYGQLLAILDGDAYSQGKKAWIDQLTRKPENLKLLEHSSNFFTLHDRELAIESLQNARSLDMDNPKWPQALGQLYSLEMTTNSLKVKNDAAGKALEQFEIAYKLSTDMGRGGLVQYLAKVALAADKPAKAKEYAEQMLSENGPGWNFGNNIHHGNMILGRIALTLDDVEEAKQRLVKAGETPGSPQLNSFGPNMTLAKELLQKGEKDVVLEYFELCSKFWKSGKTRLDEWSVVVKDDKIPDFGANLNY